MSNVRNVGSLSFDVSNSNNVADLTQELRSAAPEKSPRSLQGLRGSGLLRGDSSSTSSSQQQFPSLKFFGSAAHSLTRIENRAGTIDLFSSRITEDGVKLQQVWNRPLGKLVAVAPRIGLEDFFNDEGGVVTFSGAPAGTSTSSRTNFRSGWAGLKALRLKNAGNVTVDWAGSGGGAVSELTDLSNSGFLEAYGSVRFAGKVVNYGSIELSAGAAQSGADNSMLLSTIRSGTTVFENRGTLTISSANVAVDLTISDNFGRISLHPNVTGSLHVKTNHPGASVDCADGVECVLETSLTSTRKPVPPDTRPPLYRKASILTVTLKTLVQAKCRSCTTSAFADAESLVSTLVSASSGTASTSTSAVATPVFLAFADGLAHVFNRLDGVGRPVVGKGGYVEAARPSMPETLQLRSADIEAVAYRAGGPSASDGGGDGTSSLFAGKPWLLLRSLFENIVDRVFPPKDEDVESGVGGGSKAAIPSPTNRALSFSDLDWVFGLDFKITRFIVGTDKQVFGQKNHTLEYLQRNFVDTPAAFVRRTRTTSAHENPFSFEKTDLLSVGRRRMTVHTTTNGHGRKLSVGRRVDGHASAKTEELIEYVNSKLAVGQGGQPPVDFVVVKMHVGQDPVASVRETEMTVYAAGAGRRYGASLIGGIGVGRFFVFFATWVFLGP